MTLHVLASGTLIADPQSREGQKGRFTTATLRTDVADATLVSIVAFGDMADRLLELGKGDAISVSGAARLTQWTGRDGAEKRGISVVAMQVVALKPKRALAVRGARRYVAPRAPKRG